MEVPPSAASEGLASCHICGKVSPVVYWAPGALVLDRPLVVIERGALIGAGAGLTSHAGTLTPTLFFPKTILDRRDSATETCERRCAPAHGADAGRE